MRLITLEEHYRSKLMDAALEEAGISMPQPGGEMARRLANLSDLAEHRIADMDKAGIDLQVLSHTVPSPEILTAARAIPLAQQINDEMAEAVASYPKRFAAFATLPVADPAASATELERTVQQLGFKGAMINGVIQGRFLDDPSFSPILECAEALGVPAVSSSGTPTGSRAEGVFLRTSA